MLLHSLRPGATAVVWPVASLVVFLVSMCVVPLFFDHKLVEALLGYLFREHHLVSLHNNLMMHIPVMSSIWLGTHMVREPLGLSLSRVTPG